jgi:hypothetical protein
MMKEALIMMIERFVMLKRSRVRLKEHFFTLKERSVMLKKLVIMVKERFVMVEGHLVIMKECPVRLEERPLTLKERPFALKERFVMLKDRSVMMRGHLIMPKECLLTLMAHRFMRKEPRFGGMVATLYFSMVALLVASGCSNSPTAPLTGSTSGGTSGGCGAGCEVVQCQAENNFATCPLPGDGGTGTCCFAHCIAASDDSGGCGGCGRFCSDQTRCVNHLCVNPSDVDAGQAPCMNNAEWCVPYPTRCVAPYPWCVTGTCFLGFEGLHCAIGGFASGATGILGTCCNQTCVDTSVDGMNCGGCYSPCPPGTSCNDGGCQ